jgi:hypothetical protein
VRCGGLVKDNLSFNTWCILSAASKEGVMRKFALFAGLFVFVIGFASLRAVNERSRDSSDATLLRKNAEKGGGSLQHRQQ